MSNHRAHHPDHFDVWTNPSVNEGARYEAFRHWVQQELGRRLCWPRSMRDRVWQMSASVKVLEEFCAQLSRSGYLFDGRELAGVITEQIDWVAQRQRTMPIDNIYSFLRKCIQSNLRIRAEELRGRAVHVGVHVSQIEARARGAIQDRSMVEILADQALARREAEVAARAYRRSVRREESRQIDLFPAALSA